MCSSVCPSTESAKRLIHEGSPFELVSKAMIVCPMEKGFTYFLPSNSSVPPYSYSSNEKSGFMTRSTTALRSHVVEPAAERMTVLSNASSSID